MSNILIDRENDVIRLDEDTPEDQDEGGLYPYDPTKEDIDIREDPQTVFELIRKINQDKIIINPDFQRNIVWKHEQKSQFIESVILNFPLPPWYVNQTVEGKYIIVDGLQRTSSLYGFVNDEFELKGLKALTKLNGYKFSDLADLEGDYQTRIEDKKLTLYIIKPSVSSKVIIDIFNRINTGGTQLNQQEVRNCIFSGKSTKLLKELSEKEYFKDAIDRGISSDRMKDREAILRYLAFKIFDYEKDYFGDVSDFLEKAMKKLNQMDDENIEILKKDFERVMKLTINFFGKNNFRLFNTDKNGNRQKGRINIALMESVAYFFSIQNDQFLILHQDQIKINFERLLKNTEYLDAIRSATSGKAKVTARFNIAQKILGDI
jgi:uncharacterized protein with ParB-like and HNH nuclease domain